MKTSNFSIIILLILFIFACKGNRVNHNSERVRGILVPQDQNSNKDYLQLGFDLMQNDGIGDIKIGLNIKNVEPLIGNPTEKTEPVIWGADGLTHQTLKYSSNGIELDIIQKPDSTYLINMITATAPCKYKTIQGIGIDSNLDDVKKAYRNYIDSKYSNDKVIIAGSIYGGIIFKFENQKVKSIYIGAQTE